MHRPGDQATETLAPGWPTPPSEVQLRLPGADALLLAAEGSGVGAGGTVHTPVKSDRRPGKAPEARATLRSPSQGAVMVGC